jgi:hypothetical protein
MIGTDAPASFNPLRRCGGGVAVAARAQQPVPVVGYLRSLANP